MNMKLETSQTEGLKLGLVKRIGLVVLGGIVSVVMLDMLSMLRLIAAAAEPNLRARGAIETVGLTTFLPSVITLAPIALMVYLVYDLVRVILRYRRSRRDDQQMYP